MNKIIPIRKRKISRRSDIIIPKAGPAAAPQQSNIDLIRLQFLLEEATESREAIEAFIEREPESAVQATAIIAGMRAKLSRMDEDNPDRFIVMRLISCWQKVAEHARKNEVAQRTAEDLEIDLESIS